VRGLLKLGLLNQHREMWPIRPGSAFTFRVHPGLEVLERHRVSLTSSFLHLWLLRSLGAQVAGYRRALPVSSKVRPADSFCSHRRTGY
jgi:hypothetical protein